MYRYKSLPNDSQILIHYQTTSVGKTSDILKDWACVIAGVCFPNMHQFILLFYGFKSQLCHYLWYSWYYQEKLTMILPRSVDYWLLRKQFVFHTLLIQNMYIILKNLYFYASLTTQNGLLPPIHQWRTSNTLLVWPAICTSRLAPSINSHGAQRNTYMSLTCTFF